MVGRKTILINGKEVPIRSYEVSIWTLQDSFITVLKWANIENKGQIQDPELTLDTDGTQEFKFSIPMYLNPKEENPMWYNTLNGNLMVGMRKIKVILNKKLEDEGVFEFLITKVTENHKANVLTCDVSCEGLAFHELGKIGYKISLSPELYQLDYENWFANSGDINEMPRQTIQYWNDKTDFLLPYPNSNNSLIPNQWYYKIEMNWNTYDSNMGRDSDKIYEDAYISSWKIENGNLISDGYEQAKEKERPVNVAESNVYNITQEIAEAFGVFCKYQYTYDDNYHITSRVVVYYNSFIEEQNGYMDLTYPYHTSEITREMDSTEITTKLFIRPVDYQNSDTGQVTIMSVDANKSREDYILNFDYLHKFNIITDEQYDAIIDYETQLHNINLQLENYSLQMANLNNKIIEHDAIISVAENEIEEADKQISDASAHITASNNQVIEPNAPKILTVAKSKKNGYYVKAPFTGMQVKSVKLYVGTLDYTNKTNYLKKCKRVTGILQFDSKTGDLTQIIGLSGTGVDMSTVKSVYLTGKYNPNTYYNALKKYWQRRKLESQNKLKYNQDESTALKTKLENITTLYNEKLIFKQTLIKEFERMMGPALREGYWQPDNYQDYGNKYHFININDANFEDKMLSYKLGDTNVYNGNNTLTYQEFTDQGQLVTKSYICIKLAGRASGSQQFIDLIKSKADDEELYFIYYDYSILQQDISAKELAKCMLAIGGDCRFTYAKNGNAIIPILVIESSKAMTDEQINFLTTTMAESSPYNAPSSLARVKVNDDGEITIVKKIDINSGDYIAATTEAYNRIIIDSLFLKQGESFLQIKIDDQVLTEYEDYTVHIETDLNDALEEQHQKYMIDIKPTALFKYGKTDVSQNIVSINYELSNADIMIYLDALQVSKENSQPKVSYNISLSIYDPYTLHNIYQKLSKIVHINDLQLKFENVQGYISHIEMNLDRPWEDSIEIKNYKTKFEDLFSNIVAQTNAMQKKSFGYDVASTAFNSNGILTKNTVQKMLNNNSSLFSSYIDTHIVDSTALNNTLTTLFTDAGSLLDSGGASSGSIRAITSQNAQILANFAESAASGLSKVQITDEGIFMGANQKISLFSGSTEPPYNGVSIDLSPDRLILGAASSQKLIFTKTGQDIQIIAQGEPLKIVYEYEAINIEFSLSKSSLLSNNNIIINDTTNTYKLQINSDNTYQLYYGDEAISSETGTWEFIEGQTAAKFTDEYIVLTNGNTIFNSENFEEVVVNGETITQPIVDLTTLNITGTSSGLLGAKFTNNSIGLAVEGESNQINAILMNSSGITIGSGVDVTQSTANLRNTQNGSFVRIASTGLDIGSGAKLYINTSNFKLISSEGNNNVLFQIGNNLNTDQPEIILSVDGTTATFSGEVQASKVNVGLGNNGTALSAVLQYISDSIADTKPDSTNTNGLYGMEDYILKKYNGTTWTNVSIGARLKAIEDNLGFNDSGWHGRSVNARVTALENNMSDLTSRVSTNESDITNIKTWIGYQSSGTSLADKVSTNITNISTIQNNINDLQNWVNYSSASGATTLNERVINLENINTTIQGNITSLNTWVGYSEGNTSLVDRVSNIENISMVKNGDNSITLSTGEENITITATQLKQLLQLLE